MPRSICSAMTCSSLRCRRARVTVPPAWLKTPDGAPGLKGEYFSNTSLSGDPALTRTDANIDFNWGNCLAPAVAYLRIILRCAGRERSPSARTTPMLAIRSDDGVRLTIDGTVVIDNWGPSNSLVVDASVVLTAGTAHTIKLEYLEQTGGALCRLAYTDMERGAERHRPQCLDSAGNVDRYLDRRADCGTEEPQCRVAARAHAPVCAQREPSSRLRRRCCMSPRSHGTSRSTCILPKRA